MPGWQVGRFRDLSYEGHRPRLKESSSDRLSSDPRTYLWTAWTAVRTYLMNVCTYLMPIRRGEFDHSDAQQLRWYLDSIASVVSEIMVVDGSPEDVFAAHHQLWSSVCRHERVDRKFGFLNDKVNGIQTGVRQATTGKIILADDDIRFRPDQICEMVELLDGFEVVRPQNYFALRWIGRSAGNANNTAPAPPELTPKQEPVGAPWICTEAARMLINRATLRTADYPGTCAFQRETFLGAGEYDGDVLFDNEELIRHLARSGSRICYANDFFVRKVPPSLRKWIEQRPRQAYEDFGLRAKTALFALLPIFVLAIGAVAGVKSMVAMGLTIAAAGVCVALIGRRRGNAADFFPFHICLFAPLWLFERCLSTYWAFYWFLRRGGYPFGDRLLAKGIGRDWVAGGKIVANSPQRW